MNRRNAIGTALAACVVMSVLPAQAQGSYPEKPIRIIVPFGPGGGLDVFARIVGNKLQERLGQTVVVENKAGAAGNIGADFVAKAAPDGYTLLLGQNGLAMAPWLYPTLPFDPMKDLAPITIGVTQPLAVAVNVDLPVRSIAELVAYAKANPGKLNYATPGSGTPHHLATELFMQMTDIKMLMVPYKGLSAIMPDLFTGRVGVFIGPLNSMVAPMQAGKLRILALAERSRLPAMGHMPTIHETVPGYEANTWAGLMAPAGTPDAIVRKLNDEIRAIVRLPDVSDKLAQAGFEVAPTTPDEMRAVMRRDHEKWGRVIKSAGIKAE